MCRHRHLRRSSIARRDDSDVVGYVRRHVVVGRLLHRHPPRLNTEGVLTYSDGLGVTDDCNKRRYTTVCLNRGDSRQTMPHKAKAQHNIKGNSHTMSSANTHSPSDSTHTRTLPTYR
jgi:hypothetical protein